VDALGQAGLSNVSVGEPATDDQPARRVLQALTATREPSSTVQVDAVPWPERVVSIRVGSLEVVNVHSPTSPKPGLAKVRTHEAVHRHLSGGSGPRLVCGDLNTPRKEHPDGRVWSFARDRYGRLRPERGERWDRAELALIKGLEPHGFSDAFRALNGLQKRELSWEWQRWGGGYRLDHLIVSAEISVPDCRYLHEWRTRGASDHSALTAELEWR
jgi:endonuclease/exonuclease/phosphatase family metal-dependent hydrolase